MISRYTLGAYFLITGAGALVALPSEMGLIAGLAALVGGIALTIGR